MQQPPSQPPFADARQGMGLLILLTRAWSDSFLVFLRTGFGSRFQGMAPVGAFLLMVFWTLLFMGEGHDPMPMKIFILSYLAVNGCHQAAALWRKIRRIPDEEHSRYCGYPRLLKNFPRFSETTIKVRIEPIFVCLTGCVLWTINVPLGLYFICGSFCMNASVSLVENWHREQALRVHDQMIEQQQMSERIREFRERRF